MQNKPDLGLNFNFLPYVHHEEASCPIGVFNLSQLKNAMPQTGACCSPINAPTEIPAKGPDLMVPNSAAEERLIKFFEKIRSHFREVMSKRNVSVHN